ncbi:unnamed protein product [Lupinus luteus]|uniref:Dof zinc finger protein n=1 Tax=Lupinus luteus TaxID=3873 RepID=A0AAV1XJT0_LUPLU
MDPSSGQHQEIMSSQSLESMLVSSNSHEERKPRPQPEEALKCPRCDSTNTKFCYYNNYSLSQPRYFCKSCRRYWTKGGTLRNVPVGGGCRKPKRYPSSPSKRVQDQTFTRNDPNPLNSFPQLTYDNSSDQLTLALTRLQKQSCGGQLGFDNHDLSILGNPTNSLRNIHGNQCMNPSTTNHGLLDALRSGFLGTQNNNGHNMYYLYGNGEMREVDNGIVGERMLHYDQQIISNVAPQAVNDSVMKQERSESRVLGGFPWQINGDTNMVEVDSGRACWNGFMPSWNGLLHSPLM